MPLDDVAQQLIDRTWSELADGPDGRGALGVALLSKGPLEDVIPGLSDIDFRIVLDTVSPTAWRWADDAFYRVFRQFAIDFPDHWRMVEHTPGSGYATRELDLPKPSGERPEWVLLHETRPNVVPPADKVPRAVSAVAARHRLRGYAAAYDARRDPPINVAPEHVERHLLFSVCWHYYAPALRCAAVALGETAVVSKWDALRWRAREGGSLADVVLAHAEGGFTGEAGDLADRCSDDVARLVKRVSAKPSADDAHDTTASSALTTAQRVATCMSTLRMFSGRWRFYAGAPQGYDVDAVLRIDRGHLANFVFQPIWSDPLTEQAFYQASRDEGDMRRRMLFFKAQHQSGDMSDPRGVFTQMREHLITIREAMEAWYARLI